MQQPPPVDFAQDRKVRSFQDPRSASAFRNVSCFLVHSRPGPLTLDARLDYFPLDRLPKGLLHFCQSGAELFTIADRSAHRPFDDKVRVHQREDTVRIARFDCGKPVAEETSNLAWRP